MEANKENVNRIAATKIPLPLDPLPALPKHLLLKNSNESRTARLPLKTIQPSNIVKAGPSNTGKVVPNNPKVPLKIDTRHVTMRQRNDELDWEYKIFKENKDSSVVVISDDEDERLELREGGKLLHFAENMQTHCLEAQAAVTPAIKSPCLESSRVRNIKKSLKRPHSRELQGLSPIPKQQKQCDERVKRRLHFNERGQNTVLPDYWEKMYMACINRDYSSDMFNYLLTVEKKSLDVAKMPGITRACIVNWLMKINGPEGNPAVVQSACWYLDSILGTCHVETNRLQVVATACFWIAQKLHGSAVPALSLVNYADRAFSAERLVAAEKAVITKLEFPHQPIIPHDFIPYLSWWCDHNNYSDIEVGATFLCMAGLVVDKALCKEYPSVIAAASVRNTLLLLKKKHLMERLQKCPLYVTIEKKASKLSHTCSILRRAVRAIAAPQYEYKAPLVFYGHPPKYIAHAIVAAASDYSLIDTRNMRDC